MPDKKIRISEKQEAEIAFLSVHFDVSNPTREEKEEYVRMTVLGEGSKGAEILKRDNP